MGLPDSDPDPLAALLNARVRFWTCPVEHPREPLRVTVTWDGHVATCADCGRKSTDRDAAEGGEVHQ